MLDHKPLKRMTLKHAMLLITYTVFLVAAVTHLNTMLAWIALILAMLKPFLYGFALAFVFHLPMKFFLKHLPATITKNRNLIAGICALFLILAIFICMILVIVPAIRENVVMLMENMPSYIESTQMLLNEHMKNFKISEEMEQQLLTFLEQFKEMALVFLKGFFPALLETAKGIVSGVSTLILSVVFAVYFTISKDTLTSQTRRVVYAFTPEKVNTYLHHIKDVANMTFSSFISGQLMESLIIGVLCYIGSLVLQIPYAPIISLIVGATNIIPYFGPIISTIACGFLILFVNPTKAIIFVIFGICLQQFESNLIYPRVVGNSVGLSGLWVLFAVSIGGGLFGIAGLILGLPTFAVLYTLAKEETQRRILKKEAMKQKQKEKQDAVDPVTN